jgi:tryptophan synthase beta chain
MPDDKIYLPESEIPTSWYNVLPDLPTPLPPPLNPETKKPVDPEVLGMIFPKGLIEQEMSPERWIEIPEPVREIYKLWRPSPLVRARRLEQAIGTKAKIYYKDESRSPAGSHKPNTAVAQAYYNKVEGVKRMSTETGAGQWGTALSMACSLFDMQCTVYMVRVSYDQKPYRSIMIRAYGADIHPSPSDVTNAGRAVLEKDPSSTGSLGLAISEAVEDAATHDDTNYGLGSVLNHVLLHQTVTGLETKKQLESIGEEADVLVGCVGGGSNFAGLVLPFVPDKLAGAKTRFLGVEPEACPTLTRGQYRYDFGDVACMTPLLKMHTLGHGFYPPPIHAGGLRYHGDAPVLCSLVHDKVCEAKAYYQKEVFEAGHLFLKSEGFLPAPETTHAIRAAIDEADGAPEGKVIVFLYSGHGLLDLASYQAYLGGELVNYAYPDEAISEALKSCPVVE